MALVVSATAIATYWPPCGSRSKALRLQEAVMLRAATLMAQQNQMFSGEAPRVVADLVYDEALNTGVLAVDSSVDYADIRFGALPILDIAKRAMTREGLDAEIARVFPDGDPAWDALGPVTLCFDRRAYDDQPLSDVLIVGMLKNYPGTERGKRVLWVAYSDSHVAAANGPERSKAVGDDLAQSLAYYDSLGIPMPEEMVKELREAVGVE